MFVRTLIPLLALMAITSVVRGDGDTDPQPRKEEQVLELKATGGGGPEMDGPAATVYEGTRDRPKTLLAGMHFIWPVYSPTETVASIHLSAYSNTALTAQEFPGDIVWTATGPGGNFLGNSPSGPKEKTGINVHFYATQPGAYDFTARRGSLAKTIRAYVARFKLDRAPAYMFADATGRVPLEISLEGTGGNNFALDTANLYQWRVRYKGDWGGSIFYFDMPSYETTLDAFAPSWDDTTSHNGDSNAYKVVTKPQPFKNTQISTGPGVTDDVRIQLDIFASLKLYGEETNSTWINSKNDAARNIRFADKRWLAVEIDKQREVSNGWATLEGTGRYEHIASDDNSYGCPGYSSDPNNRDRAGTFTAGDDEKYSAWNEIHYHLSAPRGFDEAGEAFAGMEKSMAADGCRFKALLYDNKDFFSDDEEEYVAKALGGGIGNSLYVSYKLKSSTYFGEYYDLDGTSGKVSPELLPNAKWEYTLSAPANSVNYTSVALDASGFALAVYGAIAAFTGPVDWVAYGLAVASLLVSSANEVNDVSSFVAYDRKAAVAQMRTFAGVVGWDSGSLSGEGSSASGTGSAPLKTFGADGMWWLVKSTGCPVNVGDSVRSGFDVFCSAQNESFEIWPTDDVHAILELKPDGGGANDLRRLIFRWR